jgi:hypothetical protein
VSILGEGIGDSLIFLRIPPYFFRSRWGDFYIDKEGKGSINVIDSHFSIKISGS